MLAWQPISEASHTNIITTLLRRRRADGDGSDHCQSWANIVLLPGWSGLYMVKCEQTIFTYWQDELHAICPKGEVYQSER